MVMGSGRVYSHHVNAIVAIEGLASFASVCELTLFWTAFYTSIRSNILSIRPRDFGWQSVEVYLVEMARSWWLML